MVIILFLLWVLEFGRYLATCLYCTLNYFLSGAGGLPILCPPTPPLKTATQTPWWLGKIEENGVIV